MIAEGYFADTRVEILSENYACTNQKDTATDGVSLGDYFSVMGVFLTKFEEFKN